MIARPVRNRRVQLAQILCHFAEDDDWVSAAAVKKLARHLDSAGVCSSFHRYPGTKHWKRTIRFLRAGLQVGNARRSTVSTARQRNPADGAADARIR